MRGLVLRPIVIAVSLATASAHASCNVEHETVIRGRFVRCESAEFYWEASGADAAIQKSLGQWLAETDPQFRDELKNRLNDQGALPGSRVSRYAFVAVILVDWQATTATAWNRDVSEVVELKDQPREFHEMVRYLWRGTAEACQNAAPYSSVDLWVPHPCCDTSPVMSDDGCLMRMNYAQPAPRPMSDALAKALNGTATGP